MALTPAVAVGQDPEFRGPEFRVAASTLHIQHVKGDNPVLYDNDWWYDIVDAGYCIAQHKLGKLDLRGLIVTRDMWPDPPYSWEASAKEFSEFRKLALESGITTCPDLTPGAREALQRPASGRIADTRFQRTLGSDLIVSEAHKASPEKPLLIFVGGAPTTVATALLQDSEISKNIIIFWLAMQEYNAKDAWAARVMLTRSAVVHYNFQLRNGLTREQLNSLPDNPLCKKLKESQLVYDNGVGDGVLLAWLFDNSLLTGAERRKLTNDLDHVLTDASPYSFLHIPDHHKRSEKIAQSMIDVLNMQEVWATIQK